MEKTTMNVIKNDGPISADQVKTQGLTENNEKAMKFEEITVTFHPNRPNIPIIVKTEKKQLKRGIKTHKISLNTNQRVKTIKRNTPAPKTIISLLI